MSLVSTVVRDILLVLKAIDAASAVPAQDFEDTVIWLNRVLTRWEANGLALGWSNVANPDDVMPSPDEAELAIVYNVAAILPGYARPSDFGQTVELAKVYLAELRRDRLVEMPLELASDLPVGYRQGHWNIIVDEPN